MSIRDQYVFITNKDENMQCIGIRKGKFEGVVYKYGKVSLGEETQETSYEAPSVSLTSSSGSVTISGTSTLTPTGVSVTSSTGTLQGTFWSSVDDSNSDISWTEVHKAA